MESFATPAQYEMGYPKHKYHTSGADRVVYSSEEETALPGGWYDSPADFGILTTPNVEEMAPPNVPRPMPYAPNAWGPPLPLTTTAP
jgi:hypothetical protein